MSFQNLCIASVQLDGSYSMKDLDNNGIHHKTLFLYQQPQPPQNICKPTAVLAFFYTWELEATGGMS